LNIRIEYVIVGFVILAVALLVIVTMLRGVAPGIDSIFTMLGG